MAYDVIGHCYYMESGNEETNEVSFNLGAHIHQIGHFDNIRGQFTERTFTSAQLGGAEVPYQDPNHQHVISTGSLVSCVASHHNP